MRRLVLLLLGIAQVRADRTATEPDTLHRQIPAPAAPRDRLMNGHRMARPPGTEPAPGLVDTYMACDIGGGRCPMEKRQRRFPSREFKVEAVRLITEGHRPVSEVARELGGEARAVAGVAAAGGAGVGAGAPEQGRGTGAATAGAGDAPPRQGVPGKSSGVLREPAPAKYACITQNRGEYPVRLMCRVLAVTPSGYYAFRTRRLAARVIDDALLTLKIEAIRRGSAGRYDAQEQWRRHPPFGYAPPAGRCTSFRHDVDGFEQSQGVQQRATIAPVSSAGCKPKPGYALAEGYVEDGSSSPTRCWGATPQQV